MKIRRYTCKDMQEALLKVKIDLGSEAVIMSSKKVRQKGFLGLFKKPLIEVVAAIDDEYVRPSRLNYNQRPAPAYDTYRPQPAPEKYVPVPEPVREQMAARNDRFMESTVEKAAVPLTENPVQTRENQKISELEDKVKNLESMLNKIYQAVQSNKTTEPEEGTVVATIQTEKHTAEKEDEKKAVVKEAEKQAAAKEAEKQAAVMEAIEAEVEAEEFSEDDDKNNAATKEKPLLELRNILFEKDVEPKLIEKILEKITERGGHKLDRDEVFNLAAKVLTASLGEPEPIKLVEKNKPHVAIFLGPTGVGKTTTLAKIAADFTFRGKKVGLITADTYRIAAVEQLKTYAEILNLQVTVVYSPGEIKEAIESLKDNDLILIDTAGRSHRDKQHFDELKTLVSAADADENYLVISSNTSRFAVREILEYYAFIKNYKLLFTKLDESPASGVIINARYFTGKPLSYTTAGQSVPDDLDIANVDQIVASLLHENSD
ncbi:MAG: flagellar biosynthesis protein FlhF [Clostridiaceae bacterium]|nr:flagellar biosynthesis protein FlhF [Clostridiaceae bacterium]